VIQANGAVLAITTGDFEVSRMQPPDGLVIRLADGSRWAVMAHKQAGARR